MRFGIFSDVHANLEALQTVLKALRAEGVSHFVCCGDAVGYGPDPRACIQVLRELRCPIVAGNHEYGLVGRTPLDQFNRAARETILWTRRQLNADERLFLEELPLSERLEPLFVVHATPSNPVAWEYMFTVREADEEMRGVSSAVCVVGHTHYPFVVEKAPHQPSRLVQDPVFRIDPASRYVINAGSTGQPRDGDPRACCLLLDLNKGEGRFLRLEYDIRSVQQKIAAAGLPEFLAVRLASGR